MKKLCKAKTKNGDDCIREGVLNGYCIIHFSMIYKVDKVENKE